MKAQPCPPLDVHYTSFVYQNFNQNGPSSSILDPTTIKLAVILTGPVFIRIQADPRLLLPSNHGCEVGNRFIKTIR